MAKKASIGAGIGISGEREFRQAIAGINKDLGVLNSEMKKVTAEFADNNSSIESLTRKDEILNSQLDTQRQKIEAIKNALENSKIQYGENDNKTKDWQKTLNNTEADLFKLDKELRDNKAALENAVNPANTLGNELNNVGDNAGKAGQKCFSMGDMIKANLISQAIIDGVRMLADTFIDLAKGAMDSADTIQQMSDQTGRSAEELQELKYIGDSVGTSLDTITSSQAKLTRSMNSARNGNNKYAEAFDKLHISITNSDGSLRDSKTVMMEALGALNKVGNETERDSLAMDIFGKSAQDLNPLIKLGSDELKRMGDEARSSGAIMSNETIATLDNLGDSMGQLKQSLTGKLGEAFASIAPSFEGFIGKIKNIDLTPITDFLKFLMDNSEVIIAGVVGLGTAMLTWNIAGIVLSVVEAIKAFKLANEGATIAQYALNLAMSLNPIAIIVTIVAALVSAIITLWKTNDDFRNKVIEIWNNIKAAFKNTIDSIVNFVTVTIPEAFTNAVEWLKSIPSKIWDAIVSAVDKVKEWGANLKQKALEAAAQLIIDFVEKMKELPENIVQVGTNLVHGIWNGIKDGATWLWDKIKGWCNDIVTKIKNFFGIESPSKVMKNTVGKNLALGIGDGFSSTMSKVSVDMAKSIPASFDTSLVIAKHASAKALGSTIVQNFYFTQSEASPFEVARQTKKAALNLLREVLV
ncbi:MAG: hypothetical protein AAGU14_00165 [Eubacteriaceae bacterium]